MPPAPPRQPQSTTGRWLVLLLVLALFAAGYLLWRQLYPPAGPRPPAAEAQISQAGRPPTDKPGVEAAAPTADPASQAGPAETAQTPVVPVQKKGFEPDKWDCKTVARKMRELFSTLDRQPYVQEYRLGVPVQQHLLDLSDRLLRNPPVIAEEGSDLFTVLKNRAHMFRTMGLMNISLVKNILQHEHDALEEYSALFYRWTELGHCGAEQLPPAPTLDQLYEYAAFFLNTLGGQSYLSRRDPRLRLLLTFHAIRLIDRANAAGSNRYGIDLRSFLERFVEEVQGTSVLKGQDYYLDVLLGLQEKYQ